MQSPSIEFVRKGDHSLTADEAERLRREVEEVGDAEVARRIGFSRQALARCVARFGVHRSTAELARAYLITQRAAA
jgi:predicted DNA-binding protein (UPF0251 family)